MKVAPTLKCYKLIEHSPTKIKILCVNRTRDIPYCDTFDVEDLVTVQSMRPSSKCCVVHIGTNLVWHKSSMMQSMIKRNAETQSKAFNAEYCTLLRQYPFIEQRKPEEKLNPGAPVPVDDYTTEKTLKAMLEKVKPTKDFVVAQEICVGLSAAQFWDKFFKD